VETIEDSEMTETPAPYKVNSRESENGQSLKHDRHHYIKLVRSVLAICQILYAWKTGAKPPGIRDIFSELD